jgi:RNA polymerase sigma-70 factor (ECF subfamily)
MVSAQPQTNPEGPPMPRPVTAHLFSSINGVSESPHLFQFDSFGEADGQLMDRALAGVTDVLIGRQLWQEWSEYWPTNTDDGFGSFINPARKHVLSSTLTGELAWNSQVIDGDPLDYIRRLAASDEPGGIIVAGGVETVRRLFLAGVVDTLTLTVHPAVTGAGKRLFDDTVPVTRLNLVDHTITPSGNAVLTYSLRS